MTTPGAAVGFGPATAAGEYWLARCVGFRLLSPTGRLVGTVAEVEVEDDDGVVLVCRCGSRVLRVAGDEIETVWPGHFLLVLADSRLDEQLPASTVSPNGVPEGVLPDGARRRRAAPRRTTAPRPTVKRASPTVPHGLAAWARRMVAALAAIAVRSGVFAGHALAHVATWSRAAWSDVVRGIDRASTVGSAAFGRARRTLASRLLRLARSLEP
ncbi:MAG: hypothetical protein M3322_11665 [Actinomycetota bacterium]|nr:hypothetical protein [Actinomycetota bacterium]